MWNLSQGAQPSATGQFEGVKGPLTVYKTTILCGKIEDVVSEAATY